MAQIDDLVNRLAHTPERIRQIVAGWTQADLYAPSADEAWSAQAILAHLRASDDIITPRVYGILVRDEPPLVAYDERQWAEVAGYEQADFQASLNVFTLRRAELVAMLRRVNPADWQRVGLHQTRGRISIMDIIIHLIEHEEEHCAQLEAIAPQ